MPEPIQKAIGRKIMEARKAAGKTQKDLADLLDYSPMAISHFENGTRELKFSDIEKLAKFFQRDLSFFLASDLTFFRAKPTDDPLLEKSLHDFDKYVDSLG